MHAGYGGVWKKVSSHFMQIELIVSSYATMLIHLVPFTPAYLFDRAPSQLFPAFG